MEKNLRTTIRLLGIDYSVICDDSEERMQRIGFFVDKHFNEVKLPTSCAQMPLFAFTPTALMTHRQTVFSPFVKRGTILITAIFTM